MLEEDIFDNDAIKSLVSQAFPYRFNSLSTKLEHYAIRVPFFSSIKSSIDDGFAGYDQLCRKILEECLDGYWGFGHGECLPKEVFEISEYCA